MPTQWPLLAQTPLFPNFGRGQCVCLAVTPLVSALSIILMVKSIGLAWLDFGSHAKVSNSEQHQSYCGVTL